MSTLAIEIRVPEAQNVRERILVQTLVGESVRGIALHVS
jgi:hypothetical protein